MKLAWYQKIPKSSLGHLSCHEVPISDHELKVTPWEHKSSFNLHSATNLLETDEQLERINPNTHSSMLVLAYFFTFSAKLHPGVYTHTSPIHWLYQQPKTMFEYDDMNQTLNLEKGTFFFNRKWCKSQWKI